VSGLTRQQLCAELAVSESTVRRLDAQGMPGVGEGRGRRYSLEAVKAWCRVESAPKPAPPRPDPVQVALSDPTSPLARYFYGPTGIPSPVVFAPRPPPPPPPTPEERQEARRVLVLFHANKRRAAKLKRTPPWSDLDAMRAIYAEAARLTAETGVPHHVDHEIPLQGRLVSGLHVPGNLQILTGVENSRKRNKFEVTA
jgi:hypothetical protein